VIVYILNIKRLNTFWISLYTLVHRFWSRSQKVVLK